MTRLLIGTHDGLLEGSLDGALPPRAVDMDRTAAASIRCPVAVSADGTSLYAGTVRSGVWRSEDGGHAWHPFNDGLLYGEVWWLEMNAATGDLYAGTGPADIFRSAAGQAPWQELEALRSVSGRADWFLHIPPYFPRVRAIALSAEDPDLILAAVEEGWLVRTRDSGQTWTNLRGAMGHDCHVVATVPASPDRVLAASFQGVYVSNDGGETFTRNDDVDATYMTQLVVHPGKPNVVYAAGAMRLPGSWREQGADTRVYRSDDAGERWGRVTDGLPERLLGGPRAAGIDPEDPDVFVLGLTDGSVWVTDNGGSACRQLYADLPGWVTSLTVVPRP